MLNTAFQALGKAHYSLITSLFRQIIVLLPAAWLLSQAGVLERVWFSFVIAELIGLVMVVWLFRKSFKEATAW